MKLLPSPATSLGETVSAQHRIAQLASLTPVHRAFHWLHLHQPQILAWQLELTRIPAPTFKEEARAAWFGERFRELGLTSIHTDEVGNSVAELAPDPPLSSATASPPYVLVSAHLDTVFPAGASCDPASDGPRYLAPGICDNGAGLSALLALAAALRFASVQPQVPIVFAANVGEEGEGDLRGMRHLCSESRYAGRIAAVIALEGAGSSSIVTRALGSLRLRATITGPGGHSWADAGAPNPIFLLSHALSNCARFPLPAEPRTVLNAGLISGGTSVNSIPQSASVLLDLRSADAGQIDSLYRHVDRQLRDTVASSNAANPLHPPAELLVEVIGRRPAADLPADSPLLHTIRAVDRHLGLRTEARMGSTDANIPLSLGIPAVALGGGGAGGGIHTLAEWFDPAGREVALRRLLLTVLDTARMLGRPFPNEMP